MIRDAFEYLLESLFDFLFEVESAVEVFLDLCETRVKLCWSFGLMIGIISKCAIIICGILRSRYLIFFVS